MKAMLLLTVLCAFTSCAQLGSMRVQACYGEACVTSDLVFRPGRDSKTVIPFSSVPPNGPDTTKKRDRWGRPNFGF